MRLKLQIVGVHSNRRAGRLLDAAQSSDVINVRVRDEDGGNMQFVAMDDLKDPLGVVRQDRSPGRREFFGSPTMWQLHCNIPTGSIS